MAFSPPEQPQVQVVKPTLAKVRKHAYLFHFYPNATLKGMVNGIEDVILMTCSRVSIDGGSFDEITADYVNYRESKPGKYTPGQLTLTVKPDEDGKIFEFIDAWKRIIFDPESGAMAHARHYECSGELEVLTISGQPIKRWKFVGLWLQTVPTMDFDYSASEELEVDLTLKYRYFTLA